jgi:hypothetical protein
MTAICEKKASHGDIRGWFCCFRMASSKRSSRCTDGELPKSIGYGIESRTVEFVSQPVKSQIDPGEICHLLDEKSDTILGIYCEHQIQILIVSAIHFRSNCIDICRHDNPCREEKGRSPVLDGDRNTGDRGKSERRQNHQGDALQSRFEFVEIDLDANCLTTEKIDEIAKGKIFARFD